MSEGEAGVGAADPGSAEASGAREDGAESLPSLLIRATTRGVLGTVLVTGIVVASRIPATAGGGFSLADGLGSLQVGVAVAGLPAVVATGIERWIRGRRRAVAGLVALVAACAVVVLSGLQLAWASSLAAQGPGAALQAVEAAVGTVAGSPRPSLFILALAWPLALSCLVRAGIVGIARSGLRRWVWVAVGGIALVVLKNLDSVTSDWLRGALVAVIVGVIAFGGWLALARAGDGVARFLFEGRRDRASPARTSSSDAPPVTDPVAWPERVLVLRGGCLFWTAFFLVLVGLFVSGGVGGWVAAIAVGALGLSTALARAIAAQLLLARGQTERALALAVAQRFGPDGGKRRDLPEVIALALLALDRRDEAQPFVAEAVANPLAPSALPMTRLRLAEGWLGAGNPEAALAVLETPPEEVWPERVERLRAISRGAALFALDRVDDALAAQAPWEERVHDARVRAAILNNRAAYRLAEGDVDEALAAAREAVATAPAGLKAHALGTLGGVLVGSGQAAEGLPLLEERAASEAPLRHHARAWIYLHLARAREATGDLAGAEEAYREAAAGPAFSAQAEAAAWLASREAPPDQSS